MHPTTKKEGFTMAYIRKTKDEYILLSNYGYGWEEELTEDTLTEAKEQLRTYKENCPQAQYKIKKKRTPIIKKYG